MAHLLRLTTLALLTSLPLLAHAQPLAPILPTPPVLLPSEEGRTGVPRFPIGPSAHQVVAIGYEDAANYARAEVEGVRRFFKLTGMSAAVLLDGQIVWQEGFGYADEADQRLVTPATRFRIGSISKPITALAMATLIQNARLDPDAPIQTYVPTFPEKDGVITPRLLVGHLSGIRHYQRGENDTIRPRRYETMQDALSRFAGDPLVYPAGTQYSYSTYAYTLLGAAIESAAGEPFLDYLQHAVLDPIGMHETSADRSNGQIENLTSFYHRDRESRVIPAPPIDTSYKWAGGGLVSTTADLLRLAAEMMQPTIISVELRDEMWTGMTLASGQQTKYGMGWALDVNEFDHRVVAHSGGQVGCTAYLMIYPDLNAAAVVLCNVTNAEMGRDLCMEITAPFLKARDTGQEAPAPKPPAEAGSAQGAEQPAVQHAVP